MIKNLVRFANLDSSNKRNSLLLGKKALPRDLALGPNPGGGRRKTSYFWVAKLKRYETFNAVRKVRNFYLERTGPLQGRDRQGTGKETGRRSAGSSKGTLTGATGGTGPNWPKGRPVPGTRKRTSARPSRPVSYTHLT